MILSRWNIRGYNDPLKHGFSHGHVKAHKVDVICLLETRVRLGKETKWLLKWRAWNHASNTQFARNGRTWLFWKDGIRLNVLLKIDQLIHCSIDSILQGKLFFSFVYASNARVERLQLWNDLRGMHLVVSILVLNG